MIRVDGELQPIEGMERVENAHTEFAVDHMLGPDEVKRREFADEGEVDLAYAIPGVA